MLSARFSRTLPIAATALAALAVIVAFAPPHTRLLLANSAIFATAAAAIALPIGGGLAITLARFAIPGRWTAMAAIGVLLFMPLLAQLAGWDAIFGPQGWHTLIFGSIEHRVLAGMRGAILVHAVAAVPWAAVMVGLGLTQVDPAQEEAALVSAPPLAVLREITLPQTTAFWIAAALWIVVGTTAEMTVTNIYLVNTYTEALYNEFALTADAGEAALSVLPGALALAVLIAAALAVGTRLPLARLRFAGRPRSLWPLDTAGWVLAGWSWLVIGLLLAVPIGSLIDKAGYEVTVIGQSRTHGWSATKLLSTLALVPQRFAGDAAWTLVVAALAASLALVIGVLLGWGGRLGRAGAALCAAVTTLCLVVPGPLVGIALLSIRPGESAAEQSGIARQFDSLLLFLCDRSVLLPVLAQAIRALPLAVLICWYSFQTLDDDVLAAAALDGAGPWRRLWRIALPQRWRALVAAWLAALAVAMGDLAWSYLALPPGLDTLQRRVFGLVHSGVEEQVAAISLVMIAACAVLAVLIVWLMTGEIALRWQRPRHL